MSVELFADRRADEVGIIWPDRPVSPLIKAQFVCGRSTYETRFANTNGRANGEDKALINAVVADPGRQIGRRYCAAAEKGWRDRGRRLILRCGRVRVRELVQIYQRECYQVLYNHFSADRDKLMREANEAESLSLRLVMECRHVWGNRSAAELWEKRGLPKVPSMDAVFRQRDLFEHATLVPRSVAA